MIPQYFGMTTLVFYTQLVIPTKEESHKEYKELVWLCNSSILHNDKSGFYTQLVIPTKEESHKAYKGEFEDEIPQYFGMTE